MSTNYFYQRASGSSVGLLRVLVYGIWFFQLAVDPLPRLSNFPIAAFSAPGILRTLPSEVWGFQLSYGGLVTLKITLLVVLALLIVGAVPWKSLAFLAAAGLVLYQGIVRGFSGHMNHAELALLYITLLLPVCPLFDGLTSKWKLVNGNRAGLKHQPKGDRSQYISTMLLACIILSATYFFVGVVRVWKGLDIFSTPALRDYIVDHALQGGLFLGSTIAPPGLPATALAAPLWIFQAAFIGATVLELSVPLLFFNRHIRILVVFGLLMFHVSVWALMDTRFPENAYLLLILADGWFNRTAAWLDGARV